MGSEPILFMTHIGPKSTQAIGDVDWQKYEQDMQKRLPPLRPGLITEKSLCCNATVITVGRGLRGDICIKCGKPHEPPRLK